MQGKAGRVNSLLTRAEARRIAANVAELPGAIATTKRPRPPTEAASGLRREAFWADRLDKSLAGFCLNIAGRFAKKLPCFLLDPLNCSF